MTEKDLIAKIKELRQIKPRQNWVILTKQKILSEEPEFVRGWASVGFKEILAGMKFIFSHKLAFATLTAIFVLIGTFGFAQNSVPGDLLYAVKKITEQTQRTFIPEKEFNIKIVNNRLDDLIKIAQNNSFKNLAPAINEFQASVSEVARKIAKDETKNNPDEIKKIVKDVKNIEKRTIEVKSFGIQIDENIEWDGMLVELIKLQVQDLEKRTLLPEQIESLKEIKADIEAGKYSEALEKILEINQN